MTERVKRRRNVVRDVKCPKCGGMFSKYGSIMHGAYCKGTPRREAAPAPEPPRREATPPPAPPPAKKPWKLFGDL